MLALALALAMLVLVMLVLMMLARVMLLLVMLALVVLALVVLALVMLALVQALMLDLALVLTLALTHNAGAHACARAVADFCGAGADTRGVSGQKEESCGCGMFWEGQVMWDALVYQRKRRHLFG